MALISRNRFDLFRPKKFVLLIKFFLHMNELGGCVFGVPGLSENALRAVLRCGWLISWERERESAWSSQQLAAALRDGGALCPIDVGLCEFTRERERGLSQAAAAAAGETPIACLLSPQKRQINPPSATGQSNFSSRANKIWAIRIYHRK